MSLKQIAVALNSAKNRLSQGKCEKAFARDKEGKPCDPDRPEAVCWCLHGAVMASVGANSSTHNLATKYLRSRLPKPYASLWQFSDGMDHEYLVQWLENRITELTLILALKYIKKGWCRGAFAKNKYGVNVAVSDDTAKYWCLDGAIQRAAMDLGSYNSSNALLTLHSTDKSIESVWGYNDRQENSDNIIKVLRKAISYVRSL